MTRLHSPRLALYAGLAAAGLIAGLALGRIELVALAAPFALASVAGAALARDPQLSGTLTLDRDRALEQEEVHLTLELSSPAGADRVDVFVPLPAELRVVGANPRAIAVAAQVPRTVELSLMCDRWGTFSLGPVVVRVRDRLGFHSWERRIGETQPLRVYPSVETVQTLLAPLDTLVFVGNQVSRARGDGVEFADLREWVPGDRVRSINWRASARRGELWVNEQHPERNTDVVLFLDTFADVRLAGRGTLDLTVRAATSLAHRYLQRKDRVGVVSFGGYLSWLLPASGTRQLYRIVDSLLRMDIVLSFASKGIDVLPPRTLPPKALVLALTPLLDARSAAALLDLRARGFDLVVIEVSPVPFVAPGSDELSQLAYRLWRLSREALRARYQQAGVPVVEWEDGEALEVVLEEVTAYRRYARPVRA
ncbi:MAG: hypothetical protein QOF43_1676 [Gaiellaceae bacterium]|jgi:uncharacterized protein (DUF58 family)|nr:hypothetical protein [Gaiellaceae bacterium]